MANQTENHILIVDDNPTNIDVLFDYLDERGFDISVATHGQQAIQLAQEMKPDLILLDVMMPDMDGFEVCRQLKSHPDLRHIAIIFMTALVEAEDKVMGFQVGAVDYITKPFQQEEVLMRVNTHLTIRNLQRELQQTNKDLERRILQRTSELAQANADLEHEIAKRRTAYQGLSKINTAYSRFVPKEFLNLLGQQNITDVALGDHREMDMTIMFSDIRSFTSMSEQMTPKENFDFINAYLGRVGPVIRQHRGLVDKFIGDAVMALFPVKADNGIKAAIAMLQTLLAYNETRDRPDRLPIKTGIGLHIGPVMLGTVGEPERLEATVISDAVNIASRLEQLTKLYEASIIISGQLLSQLEAPINYNIRFLGQVQVKGKQKVISVFEVFDGDLPEIFELKSSTRVEFEQGVAHYLQQKFTEATACFEQVLTLNPHDRATQLYLESMANLSNREKPTILPLT